MGMQIAETRSWHDDTRYFQANLDVQLLRLQNAILREHLRQARITCFFGMISMFLIGGLYFR